MIRSELERVRVERGHAAMLLERAEAEARAVALWPSMSIRDIARMLDTSVPFVMRAGAKAGHPSRPTAMTPGQPYRKGSGWQVAMRARNA